MTPGEIVHHNSVVASLKEFSEKHNTSLKNITEELPAIVKHLRIIMLISMVLSVVNVVVLFLR